MKFKVSVILEIEMSDLGNLSYFLRMEFVNTEKGVVLHQKKYAKYILKKFGMNNDNLAISRSETGDLSKDTNDELTNATTHKQINIGSLRYMCAIQGHIYVKGLV